MMKTKPHHKNKFMKIIAMPIRALAKARDFYVKSMNSYADRVCYGGAASGWGGASDPLPRSFSTGSVRSNGQDDLRELIRAASTSTLGNRVDLSNIAHANNTHVVKSNNSNDSLQMQKELLLLRASHNKVARGVPRSASVGMAKIEEDKPCDFGDKGIIGANKNKSHGNDHSYGQHVKEKFRLFPRSKSYAAGYTKKGRPNPFFDESYVRKCKGDN